MATTRQPLRSSRCATRRVHGLRRVRAAPHPQGHAHHRVPRRARLARRGRPALREQGRERQLTRSSSSSTRRTVIDAGVDGNEARFINHSCDPNCESVIESRRVFIEAIRTIEPGEELTYDYQIRREDDDPPNIDEIFACRCGFAQCRGTMLWPPEPPERRNAKRQTQEEAAIGARRSEPAGARHRAKKQRRGHAARAQDRREILAAPLKAPALSHADSRRWSLSAVVGATRHRLRRHRHEPAVCVRAALTAAGRFDSDAGPRRAVADLLGARDLRHVQVRHRHHARGQRGRGRHPRAVRAGAAAAHRRRPLGRIVVCAGARRHGVLLLRRADHAGDLGAERRRRPGGARSRPSRAPSSRSPSS